MSAASQGRVCHCPWSAIEDDKSLQDEAAVLSASSCLTSSSSLNLATSSATAYALSSGSDNLLSALYQQQLVGVPTMIATTCLYRPHNRQHEAAPSIFATVCDCQWSRMCSAQVRSQGRSVWRATAVSGSRAWGLGHGAPHHQQRRLPAGASGVNTDVTDAKSRVHFLGGATSSDSGASMPSIKLHSVCSVQNSWAPLL